MVFLRFSAVNGGYVKRKNNTYIFYQFRLFRLTVRCDAHESRFDMMAFDGNQPEKAIRRSILLTSPVNISYIRAPRDHQSTAFPCPLRVKISGALSIDDKINYAINVRFGSCSAAHVASFPTYMYSIVPQNVCVTIPS